MKIKKFGRKHGQGLGLVVFLTWMKGYWLFSEAPIKQTRKRLFTFKVEDVKTMGRSKKKKEENSILVPTTRTMFKILKECSTCKTGHSKVFLILLRVRPRVSCGVSSATRAHVTESVVCSCKVKNRNLICFSGLFFSLGIRDHICTIS